MAEEAAYVNQAGGVFVHTTDQGTVHVPYGVNLRRYNLTEVQERYIDRFSDGVARLSEADELARIDQTHQEPSRTAAPVAGDNNIPEDYGTFSPEAAAQYIKRFENDPEAQAEILRHEFKAGGRRQLVIDSATPAARTLIADLYDDPSSTTPLTPATESGAPTPQGVQVPAQTPVATPVAPAPMDSGDDEDDDKGTEPEPLTEEQIAALPYNELKDRVKAAGIETENQQAETLKAALLKHEQGDKSQ